MFFVTAGICVFVCKHLYIQAVCGCVHARPGSIREIVLAADNIRACTESAIQIVIWNSGAN